MTTDESPDELCHSSGTTNCRRQFVKYVFPFSTCERVNRAPDATIAQPWSVLFNAISCAVILFFLVQTRTWHAFILLGTILAFEGFHLASHWVHLSGAFQTNGIHALTYVINLAIGWAFYRHTRRLPSRGFIAYLLVLVGCDLYALANLPVVVYIATQALIFLSVLVYYYTWLPVSLQNGIVTIALLIFLVIALILNEMYHCTAMLDIYPHFPYHVFIEIAGLALFYVICRNLYRL